MEPLGEEELDADEDEDDGEPMGEVAEPVAEVGQEEEEAPEAEDGERVRGVDDERVAGDGEHRRDRVHGEDDVAHLHDQEREEEGRRHSAGRSAGSGSAGRRTGR